MYHNRFSRVVPGKSSLLNGTVLRKKVWSSLGDYFFTLTFWCRDPRTSEEMERYKVHKLRGMSDLKKKIRVRAGHKAYVTKTISEVGKVIGCGGKVDLRKLRSLQSILRDNLTEIKALDRDIVEESREENIDQEVADSCEFTNCIYDCIEDIEVVFREEKCVGKESPAARPQGLMDPHQINCKGRSSSPNWN